MSLPVHNVLVMRPPVPTSSSPATSGAWNSDSSADGTRAAAGEQPSAKKRRRSQSSAPASTTTSASATRLRSASGAPLSATHELRLLRSQVAAMEDELRGLTARWEAQLPDPRTLAAAQYAAAEKRASQRTDREHASLEDALAQQQLAFAALQSLVRTAPLHSHGRALYDALHFSTAVGAEPRDRARQLRAHFERSMASVPAAVARFTQLELSEQPSLVPQSKVSVSGGEDHTLVSSVFVSEIPCASLERVFDAARAYFNSLPSAVKRHLGTDMDRQRVLLDDMPSLSRADRVTPLDVELGLRANDYVQYRRTTIASAALSSTANTVVCASLRESLAVFHVDAIQDDARHPFDPRETPRFAIAGLTLSPSDSRAVILLRFAVVYRYARMPDDPAVAHELQAHRAIFNGDLLMASLCQYLREHPE